MPGHLHCGPDLLCPHVMFVHGNSLLRLAGVYKETQVVGVFSQKSLKWDLENPKLDVNELTWMPGAGQPCLHGVWPGLHCGLMTAV